jgi:hypothetical protein
MPARKRCDRCCMRNEPLAIALIARRTTASPYDRSSAMNTGVRHASVPPRQTIFAVAFAITITAAFAIALAFSIFSATSPSTRVLVFAPSKQEGPPFGGTEVRGCVVLDPNGQGGGWVSHVSAITDPGAQEHPTFSQTSLCIVHHPQGPGRVWLTHPPSTVIHNP